MQAVSRMDPVDQGQAASRMDPVVTEEGTAATNIIPAIMKRKREAEEEGQAAPSPSRRDKQTLLVVTNADFCISRF